MDFSKLIDRVEATNPLYLKQLNERDFSILAVLARVALRNRGDFYSLVRTLDSCSEPLNLAIEFLIFEIDYMLLAADPKDYLQQQIDITLKNPDTKQNQILLDVFRALNWTFQLKEEKKR